MNKGLVHVHDTIPNTDITWGKVYHQLHPVRKYCGFATNIVNQSISTNTIHLLTATWMSIHKS